MWIGYLPKPPLKLGILIFVPIEFELGGLKLWNYNKSVQDFTKGVKDVEILVNDELKWKGKVNGGRGKVDVDYSTSIPLVNGITIPVEHLSKAESIQ